MVFGGDAAAELEKEKNKLLGKVGKYADLEVTSLKFASFNCFSSVLA